MRPVNAAAQLAAAQSGRKEAAKKEKGVFRGHPEPRQRATPSALPKRYLGERLLHLPDTRPRTPAKGYALYTPKKVFGRVAIAFPRCAVPNPGKGLRPLHSQKGIWERGNCISQMRGPKPRRRLRFCTP
jgi:hypothetical protein